MRARENRRPATGRIGATAAILIVAVGLVVGSTASAARPDGGADARRHSKRVRPASAPRPDEGAEARRHAKRASHLAGMGKCKQAIAEFDKALAAMHDPALLFNRAECHRKLGNSAAAIEDYNQFLADLPQAPNRGEVEARIAELQKTPAVGEAPTAGSASPATGRGAGEPAPTVVGKKAVGAASGAAAVAAVAAAPAGEGPGTEVAVPDLSAVPERRVGSSAGASETPGASLSLSDHEEPSPSPSSRPRNDSLTGRPWFWIAVTVVAVGAGVGAYALFSQHGTTIPPSPLGNYKF